jgi:hypothetical protein
VKDLERRAFPVKVEIRSENGGPPKLVGYAAIFNTLSNDLGWFREQIKPGAFANSIKTSDIRLCGITTRIMFWAGTMPGH